MFTWITLNQYKTYCIMNKGEILKKARAVEFWNKYLIETTNLSAASFFGGTNLKNDESITVERTCLDLSDVKKIAGLCNGSAILTCNFYSNALAILLSRYEEDITFLSPANYADHGKEGNGVFLIQPKVDTSLSFKALFSTQKEKLLEALEHELEFGFIQEYFNEKGVWEKVCQFGLTFGTPFQPCFENHVKTLFSFVLEGESPYLEIGIKGQLYDPRLLTLFADNFNTLLKEIITKIYEPVEQLNFRGSIENEVLKRGNAVTPYFALDLNTVEHIDNNCIKNEHAIAVVHNEETLTYGELFRTSNQLSRYLSSTLHLQKDGLIGIMLPRSLNMVKAILATWKSGAAYVPLATDLPDENLLQIIKSANLSAIVTDNNQINEQLSRIDVNIPVINLNMLEQEIKNYPFAATETRIEPNNLAYVIYTSGSTGKPKGVMIEHLGMINHIGAKVKEMSIQANSVVAQNAPHTFDISIWQMFAPLVAGARCIIYDTDLLLDVHKFILKISSDQVTVLELVPSYLLEMLYQLENEHEKTNLALQIIILNAETLTKLTAKRWQVLYPQIPIINTYGATEVSDDMSHYFIGEDLDSYSVPVMKQPIQHFEVHIVDHQKNRVPVGVRGEILLAGPCVGRGYINDEEKTKAAFLQGPMPGITTQERIYKTGDFGRFMADGTMEFLGRNDNMVKILGHRIELDAIENIVSAITEVTNCKAVAYTDKQLIALYYVAERELERAVIENELEKKLPKYMLPAAFIYMQEFPLTTNGKIDKKLLPDPTQFINLSRKMYVAPQSETEYTLVSIWEKILEVNQVGITDNFFDLGGHSLKLMRLKNEYHERFNVKIELKDFFDKPTLQEHAALINHGTTKKYKAIRRIKNAASYALSDAQKRVWILSQFEGGSEVYNMPFDTILKGQFDLSTLQKAIEATIERHEILRTVFREDESGEIRQWVLKTTDLNFSIDYQDFKGVVDNELIIRDYITNDAVQAFDLENGPLLRVSLFRLEEDQFVLYYNIHHIIGDGWSTEVLSRDVLAFYEALIQGKKVNLPKLRIQYKDYAVWQSGQTALATDRKYWIDQFSGALPVLDLPSVSKRPQLKTNHGRSVVTSLTRSLSDSLKEFCKENGGSLFMGLLASLNALFYKYTSQEAFIIGSPVAGRDHKELETQIGFYVNTLALKNQVYANESFLDLFLRVKNNTLIAYQHQQYSFDRLIDELALNRDMGRSPLFDVMLVLQNTTGEAKSTSTTPDDNIQLLGETLSKFDLTFTFWEVDGYLNLKVDYNTDVYQLEMVKALLQHFKQLLTALLVSPVEQLINVDYLSNDEKHLLLNTFNDTVVPYPQDKTLLDYFKLRVTERPHATALIYGTSKMSYQELDQRSNQLADFLLGRGVQQEILVPLCLDRSMEMVIAIVAILKAGGAYVPIDPAYPKDRINYILEDTAATFVLSTGNYAELFDAAEVIDLAEFDYNQYDAKAITTTVLPGHLAYCIYTSGTTGRPKGVLNQHNGLMNRLLWMRDDLGIHDGSVLVQKTPYAFDVSVWELTMPLITGCKLVIVVPGGHSDPDYLQQVIEREKVSIIHFVPSMLGVFLEFADAKRLKSVEHVVCSGEALPAAMVAKFKEILPSLNIHNLYGPTEAAIDVTTIDLTTTEILEYGVSIGKPVANTQLYIVNENFHPQPVGVIGELLIGGIQVSRGYLNKPELTAEKFVTNTFTGNGTLYKTGDLVRWLPDGNIEFLSRKDDQVKIRGNRIELEEISHQIRLKPSIAEAIVIARDNASGEKELVAYVVSAENENSTDLRAYLSSRLPEYMLPAYFVQIEHMPLTSNGKVNRRALPIPETAYLSSGVEHVLPGNEIEAQLLRIWAGLLAQDSNQIGIDTGFFSIGGNSLKIIKLRNEIQQQFNKTIALVSLFQQTTIRLQARMIMGEEIQTENLVNEDIIKDLNQDVAVIGMAVRVPGVNDINTFWNNLKNGKESIEEFSVEELLSQGVSSTLLKNEKYVRSGSFLEGKENFDAAFFGYLPDEAKLMDPQTRVFHEIVWSAIEDAGYNPATYKGLIGLYAGAKSNLKWQVHSIVNNHGLVDAFTAEYLSDKDFTNALIAHKLNLKGSVNTLNTACSTSLVAVHHAVKSLQTGENHIAVAGGITLKSNLKEGYLYKEGMISSKDGHNKAFDAASSGTVSGEGAGAVVLKLLNKALEDGDQVLAVIKGTAINNDGGRKVGFTAPSVDGQAEVIRNAQKDAGIDPQSISYIEAHGTATRLGDPIEIEALTQVFGESVPKYCAIGTVKSNIGHIDAAAGIAGFIKTVLCLKNKQLVPSLHYQVPNPEIDFERGPFYVNTELKDWTSPGGTLRAGVSSFGIGGTNAHIILEEPPQLESFVSENTPVLLTLSAKTKDALQRQEKALKEFLLDNEHEDIANLSWTLQTRRTAFNHRLSLIADDRQSALTALTEKSRSSIHENVVKGGEKELVFMFPGQGSQYVDMGRELYENEGIFRTTIDLGFETAKAISGLDYKRVLYPDIESENNLINETKYTQPLLFLFEYALTKQLEAYGLKPDVMIGHSIGEYVAACLSGVITLDDALRIVIKRGELIQDLPKGAMLGIGKSAEVIRPYLPPAISIAAMNTNDSCVISGDVKEVEKLTLTFDEVGIAYQRLHTSHAFHSTMMAPVEREFAAYVAGIEIRQPQIPYYSNVTGERVTHVELSDCNYWSDHIRNTVLFSKGLKKILSRENIILIEVGPGRTLSNFVRQHQTEGAKYQVVNLIRHPKEETSDKKYLLRNLGKVWNYGGRVQWNTLHEGKNRRTMSLPTYPFEKIAYPLGADIYKTLYQEFSAGKTEKRQDISKWFYEPVWKRSRMKVERVENFQSCHLVFTDEVGVGDALVNQLRKENDQVIQIRIGDRYGRVSAREYQLNPSNYKDYEMLFIDLTEQGVYPANIVHLFGLHPHQENTDRYITLENCKDWGFYSLLHLAKQVNNLQGAQKINLSVVTNDLQQVMGDEKNHPARSLVLGLLNVIAQENPMVSSKAIDITLGEPKKEIINNLLKEISTVASEKFIAYRHNNRWTRHYESVLVDEITEAETASKIRYGGVYLITGGLGNLGFEYAKLLLQKYKAAVILTGRKEIQLTATEASVEAKRLAYLSTLGNVAYYSANSSDAGEMNEAVFLGEAKFGEVNGVIHAAGIINGKSIRGINFLNAEDCEQQFGPKVNGIEIIAEIFEGKTLDFCVLISSLSSILGGKEFASYAAANTYLDYVSVSGRIKNSISINYDGLNFNAQQAEGSLNTPEMIEVLERILRLHSIPQIIISLTDLNQRIARWVNPSEKTVTIQQDHKKGNQGQEIDRASLAVPYIGPGTETEIRLHQLFEEFFGVKGIGTTDDFFELGGDSLKAMTISNHIYKIFNVELSLKDFYASATIKGLAKEIDLAITFKDIRDVDTSRKFENEIVI